LLHFLPKVQVQLVFWKITENEGVCRVGASTFAVEKQKIESALSPVSGAKAKLIHTGQKDTLMMNHKTN
jgi:hypothetical protein